MVENLKMSLDRIFNANQGTRGIACVSFDFMSGQCYEFRLKVKYKMLYDLKSLHQVLHTIVQ